MNNHIFSLKFSGDSGSPLMILKDGKFVHVGLTSFSLSDCSAPFPAVYSRTTYYLDWIMAAITNVPWLKTFNELLEFSYGSLVNKMILGKSSLSKNKNKYILLNQKKAHILDFFSSIWPIYRSKDTVKAALLYMISKFPVKCFFFSEDPQTFIQNHSLLLFSNR